MTVAKQSSLRCVVLASRAEERGKKEVGKKTPSHRHHHGLLTAYLLCTVCVLCHVDDDGNRDREHVRTVYVPTAITGVYLASFLPSFPTEYILNGPRLEMAGGKDDADG